MDHAKVLQRFVVSEHNEDTAWLQDSFKIEKEKWIVTLYTSPRGLSLTPSIL